MSATIAQLYPLFEQFKQNVQQSRADEAKRLLLDLKKRFILLDTFLLTNVAPGTTLSAQQKQEILIVRETLELAILLAAKTQDLESFERHMAQVKTYYRASQLQIDRSTREALILGLNLLRLLAQNRTAEFYCELELIPDVQHSNPYIKSAIDMEVFMQEGSYNRLRAMRDKLPAPEYAVFMDILMETVRRDFASCCEKAYNVLRVQDLQQLLSLPSEAEALALCKERSWPIDAQGQINFAQMRKEQEQPVAFETTAKDMIMKTLRYAKEMERIIQT